MVRAERLPGTAYEAWRELPEHVVGEVIAGELHVRPRPAFGHANVTIGLGTALNGPFRSGAGGPGGWIVLPEPEIHLGDRPDIVVPDLAGWQRARMPELPLEAATNLAPDWVCELPSPGTALEDRSKKLPLYAREGVSHAWLIDPALLEVLRLDGGGWRVVATHGEDERVRAEPFDAVEIDLPISWAR